MVNGWRAVGVTDTTPASNKQETKSSWLLEGNPLQLRSDGRDIDTKKIRIISRPDISLIVGGNTLANRLRQDAALRMKLRQENFRRQNEKMMNERVPNNETTILASLDNNHAEASTQPEIGTSGVEHTTVRTVISNNTSTGYSPSSDISRIDDAHSLGATASLTVTTSTTSSPVQQVSLGESLTTKKPSATSLTSSPSSDNNRQLVTSNPPISGSGRHEETHKHGGTSDVPSDTSPQPPDYPDYGDDDDHDITVPKKGEPGQKIVDPSDPHAGHVHLELTNREVRRMFRRICRTEYYGFPQGRRCCVMAAGCFNSLPDLINEIHVFEQKHVDKELICRHVKGALSCMSSTLKQDECLPTAKAINDKFKPQLETITNFFDPGCITDLPEFNHTRPVTSRPTRPPPPRPGGHNNVPRDHIQENLNAGIIGAAVGGILVILFLILFGICMWRKMSCRRRNENGQDKNNVSNQSYETAMTRYKNARQRELERQISDTYAEIDERRINSVAMSPDGRPLPSAPSTTASTDRQGYLTPQGTPTKPKAQQGYASLNTDNNGVVSYTRTYASLSDDDADYISPESDELPPKVRTGSKDEKESQPEAGIVNPSFTENAYHPYFILEKEKRESLTGGT